jgi:hypothetical protein
MTDTSLFPESTAEDLGPLTEAEIDGPIFDPVDDVQLGEAVGNLEKLASITESLESYTSRFLDTVPADQWTDRASVQFYTGAKQILSAGGIVVDSPIFDLSTEASDKAGIGGAMKSFLVRMWEVFRGLLATVIDKVTQLVVNYGKTSKAVRKMILAMNNLRDKYPDANPPNGQSFDMVPSWSDYLMYKGSQVSARASLEATIGILQTESLKWMDAFIAPAEACIKMAIDGKPVTTEYLSTIAAPPSAPIIWPGGTSIEFTVDKTKPGGAILNTVPSIVKDPKKPHRVDVLSEPEINHVAERMEDLARAMASVEKGLKTRISTMQNIQRRIGKEALPVSPSAIATMIKSMIAVPRAVLPQSGSMAQKAFAHANNSIRRRAR